MTTDYSHMRMFDYKWITVYISMMGKENFWKLLNDRYKWLMVQPVGWVYDITQNEDLKKRKIERNLFIKTVCLFISEGNGDYQFSKDFTTIKRI